MTELRWHPFLEEWVATSTQRQERPHLPAVDHCPFCPSVRDAASEVPAGDWQVAVFDNRFPALQTPPATPGVVPTSFSSVAPAVGRCEVILYSPRHDGSIADLDAAQIERLVDVWAERTIALGAEPEIHYVYVFENRGTEVGVTLTHPHGQLYALPFLPPRPRREIDAAERHLATTGACLQCRVLDEERAAGIRVVFEHAGWLAICPFYSRFPYEVQLLPAAHRSDLPSLLRSERAGLASSLQRLVRAYDRLWDEPMPYMMLVLQRPTDGRRYDGLHLTVSFLPIRRAADRLKYLASVEIGAGLFLLDVPPESAADRLRAFTH